MAAFTAGFTILSGKMRYSFFSWMFQKRSNPLSPFFVALKSLKSSNSMSLMGVLQMSKNFL